MDTHQTNSRTRERWTAQDYVVERRFCPVEQLQNTISDYLTAVDASEILVLTHHKTLFLQTLSFLSHNGSREGVGLRSDFDAASLRRRNPFAEDPLWDMTSTLEADDVLAALLRAGLFENRSATVLVQNLRALGTSSPWTLLSAPGPYEGSALRCVAFVRGVQRLRDERADRRFLEDMIVMANGTAQASVFRDKSVQREVDNALKYMSTIQAEPIVRRILPELVAMAQRVTQSVAAVVYLFDHSKSRGERQLVVAVRSGAEEYALRDGVLQLAESNFDNRVSATAAFARNRPLLLGAERDTANALSSTFECRGSPLKVEIALPIPAAPGTSATPNAGVLVLCRALSPASQAYGNYELALLRNVALRIALVRTSLMMEEAGAAIARVAKAYAAAEPAPDDASSQPGSAVWSGSMERPGIAKSPDLPDDLRLALPIVSPTISLAGRLTGANSATLRLLTLGTEGLHGYSELVLRRIVAWPDWRVDDDYPIVRLTQPSINAWVARTGQLCDVGDTARLPDPRYEGLDRSLAIEDRRTASELCFPIVVDKRVVGTLNLESDRVGAFVLHKSVAAACAAQVGLAIAAVRRQGLQRVLSIGSDVHASAHELAGLADKLRPLYTAGDSGALNVAIGQATKTLKDIVATLQLSEASSTSPLPEEGQEVLGIRETIAAAADSAGLQIRSVELHAPELDWAITTQRRVYLALYAVFDNASAHGTVGPLGYPIIYGNVQTVGNHDYLDLQIVNRLRRLQRPRVSALYRQPIEGSDRMHFGAYLAGAILRSLGGDVYARMVAQRDMMTVMSVPYVAGGKV